MRRARDVTYYIHVSSKIIMIITLGAVNLQPYRESVRSEMATMSDSKCEVEKQMRDDSTAQLHLESARMILLELLTLSNDIVSLLLSADELEVQTLTEIARQLLKVLNDICEHLTKLQPEILRLIGEVISSTESIAVMYKFHDVYFLSKY